MSEFEPPARQDALASVGQRALAWFIDQLVVSVPFLILIVVFFGADHINVAGSQVSSGELIVITLMQLCIQVPYHTVCVATSGQTIGKRAVGLRVVSQVDGGSVSLNYAAVRSLIPVVAMLLPVIGFAGSVIVYMRAFFHPLRKGWHDQAAGTIVVRR